MRVISWNIRKAAESSLAWKILTDLDPDVALLQEVSNIPKNIKELFDIKFHKAIGKTGKSQQFGTAIFVKGKIINELPLSSEYDWVNQELQHFAGNLVSYIVKPTRGPMLNIISVYGPAWPINTSKYQGIDIATVKLKNNPKLWVTEILWSALKNANLADVPWIVGGDFNSSETFDYTFSSGNREILDRMEALGFTECLRKYNGKLTPTFKNPRDGKIIHQIDHMFVTGSLFSILKNCTIGDKLTFFGESVSDHLPIIADFKDIQSIPLYVENILINDFEKFINRNKWIFAKTMPEIPHCYIVRDSLSENNKKLFDEFNVFIKKNGYTAKFYSKQYTYFNIGDYRYWIIENILNRAELGFKY